MAIISWSVGPAIPLPICSLEPALGSSVCLNSVVVWLPLPFLQFPKPLCKVGLCYLHSSGEKTRLREVQWATQGHTAKKGQSPGSNICLPSYRVNTLRFNKIELNWIEVSSPTWGPIRSNPLRGWIRRWQSGVFWCPKNGHQAYPSWWATFPKCNLSISHPHSTPLCGSSLTLRWNPNLLPSVHHLPSAYLSSPCLLPNLPPVQMHWISRGDKMLPVVQRHLPSFSGQEMKTDPWHPNRSHPSLRESLERCQMVDACRDWLKCQLPEQPLFRGTPSCPSHCSASLHPVTHFVWIQQFPRKRDASPAAEGEGGAAGAGSLWPCIVRERKVFDTTGSLLFLLLHHF